MLSSNGSNSCCLCNSLDYSKQLLSVSTILKGNRFVTGNIYLTKKSKQRKNTLDLLFKRFLVENSSFLGTVHICSCHNFAAKPQMNQESTNPNPTGTEQRRTSLKR